MTVVFGESGCMNYSEMTKKGKILYGIAGWLLWGMTIATVWFVNYMTPFQMDDNWYATLLYSDEKIKNVFDIFHAEVWHYMNWGGRSITHSILQLTLLGGSVVADVINTFMTILTGVLVTFMSETMTGLKRSINERVYSVAIVMIMLVALNGDWFSSMFWQSGACNYLYITVFILLFIWTYMREIPYDCFGSKEPLWGVEFWIIPLALFAGWSNENMGPVAFLFSITATIYVRKVGHVVEPWMIKGIVFSFAGSVACIIAPGNFVRVAEAEDDTHGIIWKIYERLYYEGKASFEYLILAILLLLFAIAVCKCMCNIIVGREVVYIIIAAILSWGAMILSPHFPGRAVYGTMVFLILAIFAVWQKVFEKKPAMKGYVYLGAGIIWLRGMYFLVTFICYNLGLTI